MPRSSSPHPPRLSRPDALHTGWGKTHEGGMAYYNVSWGTHHLFADLELLDNVRELCRPAVFRFPNADILLATHVGDWRLRRQGLPDVVVRDVYWSRSALFNVLAYPALRAKDTGTWWTFMTQQDDSWLEHHPSGVAIGLGLPGTRPDDCAFRLHHRHRGFNQSEPDWHLIKSRPLFATMDQPPPHVFSMEVYEAGRAARKSKSPRRPKPPPSATSSRSERKAPKPSTFPPHANGFHPPVPVEDFHHHSNVVRKPRLKGTSSKPVGDQPGAPSDEARDGYAKHPTSPKPKGKDAHNGRHTARSAPAQEPTKGPAKAEVDASRPVIDGSAYPHVIDAILDHASAPLLARLRGVSQDLRRRADTRLLAHVKLNLDKLSLSARLGPGRGRGPRFANPVCFDGAGGITWARLFEYEEVTGEEMSEVETDSEGFPTDYWDSDLEFQGSRREPMYEDRKKAPRRVEDFMRRLELSDKALLAKVRTLDLCATHLDRPTMLRIYSLFPNVQTLRTMGRYTLDTSDDWVLIKTTATTQITFTSPWGVKADIDLAPIPKNVRHAVYHVTCHPTDADALLQPEGFNNPTALEAMTVIFTLSNSVRQTSGPAEKVWIHPAFEQLAREYPPPPREDEVEGMFLHMFGSILEGLPRIKFTLVGLLELPPKFLCLPDSADTPEKRRLGMLAVFRERAKGYSFVVRGYPSMREWLDDIPRRIVFMSRQEYRASIPDEQFRLETML